MGCRSCSSRRQRAVTSAPPGAATSGLTIRQASSWLPFPPVVKPPGGWGAFGFSANTPEEAADRLAGQHLAANTFVNMGTIYQLLSDEYCSRVGSPCYKK
jgi:hypothetical protein